MIVAIKGVLASSTPLTAVVETGGLFYEVNIPLTTAERLPKTGSPVFLHTLAVYREDAHILYGFATAEDRDFFKLIVEKVSGVGPKIALNMMSRMSVQTLRDAVASGDTALLSKCPGIGKKTAERLVLELRGTLALGSLSSGISAIGTAAAPAGTNAADAVAALTALGFKLPDADKAVRAAILKLSDENASTEAIVKCALTK